MEFVARVGTPEGRVREEVFDASDEPALRLDLEKRGLHVFEVRRKGLAGLVSLPNSVKGRRRKIKDEQFLVFNQELAALLKAGLPLLQAFEMMSSRMKPGPFRDILYDIGDRVKSGEELSDAFSTYGDAFPRLYPSILKAGERTGELESVLRRFIRYLKMLTLARKKVVSALVYPAVLVVLSVTMILIMWLVVVPKFRVFFEGMDIELPWLTRTMISGALAIRNNWWLVLGVIGVAFFLIRGWVASEAGRHTLDRWRLRIPFIGRVLHQFALSEFCRSLSTLLSGGLPLLPAFEIAVSAVGNTYIRGQLKPEASYVREGKPFHEALERSGVFDDLALGLVEVGESSGSLDEMLENVSDILDDQSETQMERILSLIEPLMLVFMGVLIAVILISIYLPLFGALGQAKV